MTDKLGNVLNIDEIGYTNWFSDNEIILVRRKEEEVEV